MRTNVVDVSPLLAAEWLKTNTFNRRLSPSSVARYANDMMNGAWRLNHQGIAFDPEGVLVDGQHRLAAIIKSGVTVRMMVTWGSDRIGIDELRVRTTAEVIKFGGLSEWVEKRHIEIAKQMLALCTKSTSRKVCSTTDILRFSEKNKDAILFSHNLFTRHQRGIDTAAARAVIATASYYYDHSDLEEFVDTLYSGVTSSPDRGAAILCRDLMKSGGFCGGASNRRAAAYKMMRAIKAFCDNQTLRALQTQREAAFLVPEDRV